MARIKNPIVVAGKNQLERLTNPASISDVLQDKDFLDENGKRKVGTLVVKEVDLDGLVDGTITEFSMPTGKNKIRQNCCANLTSIQSANLEGAIEIGGSAFRGCRGLSSIIFPKTLAMIGPYAFNEAGINTHETFDLETEVACKIGDNAFARANLRSVRGKFKDIGNSAFSQIVSLVEVIISECTEIGASAFYNDFNLIKLHLSVNGPIGASGFHECRNVSDFYLNPDSLITSLGNYCFSKIGYNRTNSQIFEFDLRKSAFESVPISCFSNNKHCIYRFPNTLNSIKEFAFATSKNCDYYLSSETPPTLENNSCWNRSVNFKIFVPYQHINAYKTATNFVTLVEDIVGYASSNTFELGNILPKINDEGYGLTWYSDKDCTQEISVVEDVESEYYCKATDVQMV